ncbi:16S rRNA (guanine(966)-N(2))-methyltransferase RsmD [Agrococcus sp. ARC_14]|uniref:16S rRNA (guanine(966)-N(2))-methyltransferase RsmD n=1 Tax=Agrococcus sp. ARC_14 TaxID=2919927 RepID=UPI001F06FE27|nr:16S rRNA (guanine(966)-N(2))-methyltransferase RsmD [Agrococcus sp. ARC_14]MCH1883771.1 16S rRNA (guanine(966)-N(2))-methyltransferase RsmD [Agrococcus sp. ARC_14]
MTRIIGGLAGGVRLHVPVRGTRPTSERVREAMFGALDARSLCDGARVLDLFAGSGALGLEAASRGAESVVLVERDRAAAKVAQRNAESVAKSGAAHALVEQVAAAPFLQRSGRSFDLVFIDPPYELPDDELTAALIALAPLLMHPATVVVERARRAGPLDPPGDLEVERTRDYGDTRLHFLTTTGAFADR